MRLKNGEIYLERRDVIKKFNYSNTTFDKKSRLGLKLYPDLISNPFKGVWFIHPNIVDEVYSQKRRPNRENKNGIKSWVLRNNWMFIGCIYPRRVTLKENQKRIKLFFEELKIRLRGNDIEFFYCIENNKKQEPQHYTERHTHIHFLLNVSSKGSLNSVKEIVEKTILDFSDSRPFVETYKDSWELNGKNYTIKELVSKDRKNYDYLTFKSKSKKHEAIKDNS